MHQEIEVPDIKVPDELPEPSIPSLCKTEVGRAAKRQVTAAMSCMDKLPNEAITSMIGKFQEVMTVWVVGV